LDDSKVLEEESAKADIVIHTADASDHGGAAKAIAHGLALGHSKEKPGFWLHTGGTGILTWSDSDHKRYGEPPIPENAYNDMNGIDAVTGLPDHAFHRNVDKIVLEAGTKNAESVKTAIVCPPTTYGPGRGPGNICGRQVYWLVKISLQKKQVPQLGKGKTEWDHVHIYDLSALFVLLVDAAVKKKLSSKLWGSKGYFFAENGSHAWGDVSKTVGKAGKAKGYLETAAVNAMSTDEAIEAAGFEALSWGLNSKGKAERARKLLGWKPNGRSLEDEIPYIVDSEARREGIEVGHAKKAVGQV